MRDIIKISTIALSTLMLGACGGSDDATTPTVSAGKISTGVFLDSAVEGLTYTASSGLTGETGVEGDFIYRAGDTVSFSIAGIDLGSSKGTETIFPADIAKMSDGVVNTVKSAKIAQLLQSLDTDGNADNGITIGRGTQLASLTLASVSISNVMKNTNKTDFTGNDLADVITIGGAFVTRASATRHLETTIASKTFYTFKGINIDSSTNSSDLSHFIGVSRSGTTGSAEITTKSGSTETVTSIEANVRINTVSLNTASGEQKARAGLVLKLGNNSNDKKLSYQIFATAYHNFNDNSSTNKRKVRIEVAVYYYSTLLSVSRNVRDYTLMEYVDINKPFTMKISYTNNGSVTLSSGSGSGGYSLSVADAVLIIKDSGASVENSDFNKVIKVALRNRIKNATSKSSINATYGNIKINNQKINGGKADDTWNDTGL